MIACVLPFVWGLASTSTLFELSPVSTISLVNASLFSECPLIFSSSGFEGAGDPSLESSFFKLVVDVFDLGLGPGFDIAAALAAFTLSAAAEGFTAVVEFIDALVVVADVVLLKVDGFVAVPGALAAVADVVDDEDLKEEVDALLDVSREVVGFLTSSPVVLLTADGRVADAEPGLVAADPGLGLLLEAELALEVCRDILDVPADVFGRVEEVGRLGGSLSLVGSAFVFVTSVRGTAGFLTVDSGFGGIGFRSNGFAAVLDLGVALTFADPVEDVVDPDLVDLLSSAVFVRLAAVVVGLVDVVVLADGVVLVVVGLVDEAGLETAGFDGPVLLGVALTPGFEAAVLAFATGVFLGVADFMSFSFVISLTFSFSTETSCFDSF